MELNSGDDLISLKQSLYNRYSPCTENRENNTENTENTPFFLDEDADADADADHYARCNGLTIDSLVLDWQQLVDRDPTIVSTCHNLDAGQLIETSQLQECLFRAIIPTTEQWLVPVGSLQILQQVCSRCKDCDVADWVSQECLTETLKWKDLKLETPALRSDHGTDCRRLARRVKAFRKEPLPDHRLPLHPVDDGTGEGLEFPKDMIQKDKEKMKAVEHEALELSKDTLVYLMQCLKADMADDDRQEFAESISTYQGASRVLPMSYRSADTPTGRNLGPPDTPFESLDRGLAGLFCPRR